MIDAHTFRMILGSYLGFTHYSYAFFNRETGGILVIGGVTIEICNRLVSYNMKILIPVSLF